MRLQNFYLEKWFLDCVTEDGYSFIFYSGHISWGKIRIPYSSHLIYSPDRGPDNRQWLRNTSPPHRSGGQIEWHDPMRRIGGYWSAIDPEVHARIIDREDGYVDWHCWQPRSKVELNIDDVQYSGLGYIEQIRMTLPPWRIPMDQLRWGRFTGPDDGIVWLQLAGEQNKQWAWHNGRYCNDVGISEFSLEFPEQDIQLTLGESASLESEKKMLNIVRKLSDRIPGLQRIVPYNFLMSDENKWLSKADITHSNGRISRGWAIHELVNFNV